MRVDNNILKLDTVDPEFIKRVDHPAGVFNVGRIIERMKSFNGHIIIQTIFLHGPGIDNTTDAYVLPWLEAVKAIRPQEVMVYTIDRETPDPSLSKATHEELDAIRDRVIAAGIPCQASY
jgi:wyosine [tRNA(Phe)-imidazoG37] synthetase (radical SAM superfamily)